MIQDVVASALLATSIGSVFSEVIKGDLVKNIGDLPITIAFALVNCFLAWLLYRASEQNGARYERVTEKMEDSISTLVEALNQLTLEFRDRPCLHLDRRSSSNLPHIGGKRHGDKEE